MRDRIVTARPRRLAAVAVLAMLAGCSNGEPTNVHIDAGSSLMLSTTALPPLDAALEGRYAVWFLDVAGSPHLASVITPGANVSLTSPTADPTAVLITLERGAQTPIAPSAQVVLRGSFRSGRAELSVIGALTQGDATLRERPGQFTMFTPSDNGANGYPSHEEAGVWLFNMQAASTPQNDFYVRLTQLQPGWTYEGWMVRDYGSAQEIWLSYGKFVPDWAGAVNQPDDTGWGPFSGVADYRTAQLEDFPGDDWISNPLGLPFPASLTLPLNLREKDSTGRLRWTHVISIEPVTDKGEALRSERPFFLRPYSDSFGDLNPGVPRAITFHGEALPTAVVVK